MIQGYKIKVNKKYKKLGYNDTKPNKIRSIKTRI